MTDQEPATIAVPADTFAAFTQTLANGATNDQATAQFRDVVQAVMATQKTGSVTLTFKVVPAGGRSVMVVPDIKSKAPTIPEHGVFFVDSNGSLHRNDPFQRELPLGQIDPRGPSSILDGTQPAPPPVADRSADEGLVHEMPPVPPVVDPDDRPPATA